MRHDNEAKRQGVLYDESIRWLDEWRDGWRNVDLDGVRRTGGSPVGRPNYQAIQEMTADRHNIPPNNRHANQAGTAGNGIPLCTVPLHLVAVLYDHGVGKFLF